MASMPIRRLRSAPSTALHAASSELKFDPQQIVIVSGEPHEGYDFADSHLTSLPYRWAVLGGAIGGISGYLAHHAFAEVLSDCYRRHVAYSRVDQRHHRLRIDHARSHCDHAHRSACGAGLPNFKGVISDPEIWTGKILVGLSIRRKIPNRNWRNVCSRQAPRK